MGTASDAVAYLLYHALISAGHAPWCPALDEVDGPCRCGRAAALAGYERARESGALGVLPAVPGRLPVAERGADDGALGDARASAESVSLQGAQPLRKVRGNRDLHPCHRGVGSTCHTGSLAASQPPAEPAQRADGILAHDLQ